MGKVRFTTFLILALTLVSILKLAADTGVDCPPSNACLPADETCNRTTLQTYPVCQNVGTNGCCSWTKYVFQYTSTPGHTCTRVNCGQYSGPDNPPLSGHYVKPTRCTGGNGPAQGDCE